jgi:hypothetical protein
MVADSIVINITPTSRLTDLSSRDVTIRFWSPSSESERRINQTRRFSFASKKGSADVDDSPAPINTVLQACMGADVRIIPFSSLIFFLAAFLLATTGVLYLALKPSSQAVSKFTVDEFSQNNPPAQAAIIPIKMKTEILPVFTPAELPSVSDDSLAVPTKSPRARKRSRNKSRDRLAMKLVAQDPPAPDPENGDGEVKLDDNPY